MSRLLVPTDGFVISRAGAALADRLDGTEQLLVVRADGTIAFSGIDAISTPEDRDAWRLLTGVGDIVLPDGARTITREGLLSGSSIWERTRRNTSTRLEVLSPADLPIEPLPSAPAAEIVRACLKSYSRPIIRIPRDLADSDGIARSVEGLLRSANVKYRRVDPERWLVLDFDPVDGSSASSPIARPEEATALLMLTAWEGGEPPISRTGLADRAIRRRLLAALTSARRPFDVRWGPAYLPVEARVQALDPAVRKPFVPVRAAFPEGASVRVVQMATPGYLVVGLALVAPTRL